MGAKLYLGIHHGVDGFSSKMVSGFSSRGVPLLPSDIDTSVSVDAIGLLVPLRGEDILISGGKENVVPRLCGDDGLESQSDGGGGGLGFNEGTEGESNLRGN